MILNLVFGPSHLLAVPVEIVTLSHNTNVSISVVGSIGVVVFSTQLAAPSVSALPANMNALLENPHFLVEKYTYPVVSSPNILSDLFAGSKGIDFIPHLISAC